MDDIFKEEFKMKFLADKPIERISDDLLNRGSFASRISDCLISNQKQESLVISLNGKWGSGKSSILNMVKEELLSKKIKSKDQMIPHIIDFTPWNFLSQDNIIEQFFSTLQSNFKYSKLKKILLSVGKVVTSDIISDSLDYIPIPPTTIASIKKLSKAFKDYISAVENKSGDLIRKKDAVERYLKKSKIHFIVFIDDLDRLNDNEIKLVFQLIKSVCGFSNITYLLAYDKAIIGKALQSEQIGEDGIDGFKYLEKLVQVEFNVPELKKEKIFDIVDRDLTALLGDKINELSISRYRGLIFEGMFKNFKTLREEKRFMNILSFCIDSYYGEIDLADLIGITYLRVLDESIISILIDYQDWLFGRGYLGNSSQVKKLEDQFFQELSKTRYSELSNGYIRKLFPSIFGYNYSGITDDYIACRISKPDRFRLYLNLDMNAEDISMKRLSNVLKANSLDDLVEYAKSLTKAQGRTFLLALVSYSKTINEKETFELLINFLFCHSSDISFAEELGLVGREYYQEEICASALRNIDVQEANKIIMKYVSTSNDVFSLVSLSRDLESSRTERLVELKNISEESIKVINDRAFSLLLDKIDNDLDSIIDSARIINYGIIKRDNDIKCILEDKDDEYMIKFINKVLYIGYVSVSGSTSGRYNTYSFNLDNIKKVALDWLSRVPDLISKTDDARYKMPLIILMMQLEDIKAKDPDIKQYSVKDINNYCKDKNINFVASDNDWEHM